MKRLDRTKSTSIKIPEGLLSRIEEDVSISGDFSSRNDYIVTALREFEERRSKILAERQKVKEINETEDFIASSGSLQSDQNIKTK